MIRSMPEKKNLRVGKLPKRAFFPFLSVLLLAIGGGGVGNPAVSVGWGEEVGQTVVSEESLPVPSRVKVLAGGYLSSDRTTEYGLKWLVRHQYADGSWSFDHTQAPGCRGCSGAGTWKEATNMATAMGLLSLLGYGQTHKNGKYKESIARGLQYLCDSMERSQEAEGSFYQAEGGMFAHALATLCLTEAYAMTRDKKLARPAQLALDFIEHSQNRKTGGWRENPDFREDTLTTGWQLLALKSGYIGYLNISEESVSLGMQFLETMQQEDGSYRLSQAALPGEYPSATAMALICRIRHAEAYDDPNWQKWMKIFVEREIGKNVDENFLTTWAIRQYGGEEWCIWRDRRWEDLRERQCRDESSCEYGSWNPTGDGSERWGRMGTTVWCLMTIETYFRHLPLYQGVNWRKP
ncbi:MAG: terpene cyclase/mutase family protein [Planctomycetia bacterium]|nr:terpene cyclase/mutase family protein [Planctomycetia bacterium]